MKIRIAMALAVVLVVTLGVFVTPAQAAFSIQDSCEMFAGGVWTGSDPNIGTCTFPPGHEIAQIQCGTGGAKFVFTGYTHVGPIVSVICFGALPFGVSGGAVEGEGGSTTISLNGRNGSVAFDGEACVGKCTVGPNLPGGAQASLPDDATDTLYVRLIDEEGNSSTGSYTVCFAVGDLTNPVIYRYVGGAWVAQTVTISGGQVCTTGSGDGAFALGGS